MTGLEELLKTPVPILSNHMILRLLEAEKITIEKFDQEKLGRQLTGSRLIAYVLEMMTLTVWDRKKGSSLSTKEKSEIFDPENTLSFLRSKELKYLKVLLQTSILRRGVRTGGLF